MKAAVFPCYLQEAIDLVHYHANERDFCIAGRKRAGKGKGKPEEEEVSRGDIYIFLFSSQPCSKTVQRSWCILQPSSRRAAAYFALLLLPCILTEQFED